MSHRILNSIKVSFDLSLFDSDIEPFTVGAAESRGILVIRVSWIVDTDPHSVVACVSEESEGSITKAGIVLSFSDVEDVQPLTKWHTVVAVNVSREAEVDGGVESLELGVSGRGGRASANDHLAALKPSA